VAEGLTNKEAAKRLFLSHHTIDSHLRHIFTKLDIKSRVELARLVTARHAHEMSQSSSERTVA
jgi:DNA-binding CsgD family transcriptional regulator